MDAVLLQDILASVSSHSLIIKMDIEGYECKVHLPLFDLLIIQNSECTNYSEFCLGFANIDSPWKKWKVYSCYIIGVGQGCRVSELLREHVIYLEFFESINILRLVLHCWDTV